MNFERKNDHKAKIKSTHYNCYGADYYTNFALFIRKRFTLNRSNSWRRFILELFCNMDKEYHTNTRGACCRRTFFIHAEKTKRYWISQKCCDLLLFLP